MKSQNSLASSLILNIRDEDINVNVQDAIVRPQEVNVKLL